jgi:hypothetical protein
MDNKGEGPLVARQATLAHCPKADKHPEVVVAQADFRPKRKLTDDFGELVHRLRQSDSLMRKLRSSA